MFVVVLVVYLGNIVVSERKKMDQSLTKPASNISTTFSLYPHPISPSCTHIACSLEVSPPIMPHLFGAVILTWSERKQPVALRQGICPCRGMCFTLSDAQQASFTSFGKTNLVDVVILPFHQSHRTIIASFYVFEGSNSGALLKSHPILVDGPNRPSDRFLCLHFRQCLAGVSVFRWKITKTRRLRISWKNLAFTMARQILVVPDGRPCYSIHFRSGSNPWRGSNLGGRSA